MIKPNIIKELYKKHLHAINSTKELNFQHLLSEVLNHHSIEISKNDLIINSVQENSPFHEIPLRNILGIERTQTKPYNSVMKNLAERMKEVTK